MKNTKRSLLTSCVSLLLCFVMLLGTTFAWFTDVATSSGNVIKTGNLDIVLKKGDLNENGEWTWTENQGEAIFDYDKWEPGYTTFAALAVENVGSLDAKITAKIVLNGTPTILGEVIDVYTYVGGFDNYDPSVRPDFSDGNWQTLGTMADLIGGTGTVLPARNLSAGQRARMIVALHMREDAGNEYQDMDLGANFDIKILATQASSESDSFGNDYDADAEWPNIPIVGNSASANVTLDENNQLTEEVTMTSADGKISATLPVGTKLLPGTTNVKLVISDKENSEANLTLEENEASLSLDVHITNIADDNTMPIKVELGEVLPVGLNLGNHSLYHVENGQTVGMTLLDDTVGTSHNTYAYDPATGEVIVYLASFSELALVADTTKAWEGNDAETFAGGTGTEADPYIIANADQMVHFSKMVSEDTTGEGHAKAYYKLISDINFAGDVAQKTDDKDLMFYPVGYWKSLGTNNQGEEYYGYSQAFMGTFDGNGNTISNIYQNTWLMDGDYDAGYYKAAMGIFGAVFNGTVKNLTVDNFQSDGEFTPTGCIAAYAGGDSTFENISLANCNPRVYNTGNGGIVGLNYNSTSGTADELVFRNITVDQTNKITALWGSYDVSCGGILGRLRENTKHDGTNTDGQKNTVTFENCHVAAIIDVNNDVCANYQYYQYRYSGMFIGTVDYIGDVPAVGLTDVVLAENSTYTLGNWNEYWYCELVKNSLASYTHDHQFGRLTKISSLSDIQDENGDWNKEGNFVIPNADNTAAECYHIFKNSEGQLYQHFHDVADESNPNIYEDFDLNGDGELNDLKEDRQCYFLPFNQLLTGYGWGSSPKFEYEGITPREDGLVKSEEKFDALNNLPTYKPGQTIMLGDLVSLTVAESKLSKATLHVTVSPAVDNDNSKVNATFALDNGTWENSSITFGADCSGAVKIVITDYFYCTPTVIVLNEEGKSEKFTANAEEKDAYTNITLGNIFGVKDGATIGNVTATVTDPNGTNTTINGTGSDWATKSFNVIKDGTWTVTIVDDDKYCAATTVTFTVNKVDKFAKKFTNTNFTYRIGNGNTVAFSSLFEDLSPAIAAVNRNVTFTQISGNASATINGDTIQFSGNGIITVTVSADGANDATVTLEVVDAVNATGATNATSNNVVLLNDTGFSSLEVSGGYALYGNGFTLTCGSDSASLSFGQFVKLDNGTLDNVQIVCPNYDYAALYNSQLTGSDNRSQTTDKTRYYNAKSAVLATGNSQILNSRISGGRAALETTNGNIVVDNSRLEGGAVATVIISAANSFVFRDVTLVQEPTESTYKADGVTGKTLMGMSVLYLCDEDGNATPTTLEGDLVQYAWVNSDCEGYMPAGTSSIATAVLGKTNYTHTIDGKTCVNLGFAYMPNDGTTVNKPNNITDNRSNKTNIPYEYEEVSASVPVAGLNVNIDTYVYSYQNTNGTSNSFKTIDNYVPNRYSNIITVNYNDTAEGLETGKSFGTNGWVYELNVDLDKLPGYKLDFSKLTMSVNGTTVTDYKVDGGNKPSTAAVTAGGVTYVLTATVNGKECTAYLKVTGTETSKDSPSKISGPTTAGFGVAKSYGSDWSGAADVLTGVKVKYWSVAENKYVEFDFSNLTVPGNAGKLNGTNNYWEYTHNNNDFTLKVTNTAAIHSGKSVYGMPILGTDGKLYFTISSTNGYVGSGTTSRAITMQYEFTDNNGGEKLTFTHTFNISYNKDDQYSYSDLSGSGKLTKLKSDGTCLAEGTMITLADGSKKAVEDLRKGDVVMSFDHLTGKITYKDVIIVVRTHSDSYYKNTFVFDDGTELVTINEHGIYDLDLNKYVNIDHSNYTEFIGHSFVSVDTNGNLGVKRLVDVTSVCESGYKYDIVTNGTLNYVAEDTLSVTHVLVDVINSFDFGENLMYDAVKMQADIEKYGLYTYDEWEEYCDISVFDQYNIPVMKVGISKGLYTKEYIIGLINTYVLDDNVQIID